MQLMRTNIKDRATMTSTLKVKWKKQRKKQIINVKSKVGMEK